MILTRSLTQAQLDRLRQSPAVRSVWANRSYELAMEDTTWITRARYAWSTADSEDGPDGLGVTGKGVELAMIDTGFDGMHEDGDNLIEFCETLQAATSTRASVACTPWDAEFNTAPAGACGATPALCGLAGVHPARLDSHDEDVSHGTHVGGTILGSGHASGGMTFAHSTIGMAPHAKFRAYSANVASSLQTHEVLSSYDDMTYKKEQGYSNVVAVNNSWGGGGGGNYNPNDPQHIAFKRAWQAGILSVFAAGNSGPEHNTLQSQCVNPYVACVAATTKPDQIVAFSSRGRPSQVADTNRNGVAGDPGDIAPDNHDWRLGQALELGRYRPTLAAPGVAINSMKAIGLNIGEPTSAACRETQAVPGEEPKAFCYVQAQGTSMATPHVTGAIGLIVEAYRKGHGGRTPSPNTIIDILERSANRTKLPGWEAEEQGAGRLDAYEAVRLARSYSAGPKPNLGTATPPYVGGGVTLLPGEDDSGCTATLSWTAREGVDPIDPPPVVAPVRYGQHFIDVPPNVDRLRVTVTWPRHDLSTNLYARLWRPGVNPNTDSQTPDRAGRTPAYHHARVFPDQEGTGIPVGLPPTLRLLDVRAAEESNPAEGSPGIPDTLPQGQWILRVYHRAGGTPVTCGTTDEQPQQTERQGYEYNLEIEVGKVTHRPSVRIDSPAAGASTSGRFVEIRGRAGYPPPDNPPINNTGHSWEGVTNWEVPGSAAGGDSSEPVPGTVPTTLYFHGNKHATSEPTEETAPCTGQGNLDVALVGCGPFLLPDAVAPLPAPPARWGPVTLLTGVADRNIYDPNWTWCLAAGTGCPALPVGAPARPGVTTVQGPMKVSWWASTNPACSSVGAFTMGWTIRLWADGRLAYESPRLEATPEFCNVPDELEETVILPRIRAEQRLVLHVDQNALDIDQEATFVYYDSSAGCGLEPCDSHVVMPVVPNEGGGGGGAPGVPQNVRVTDLPVNATSPDYPAAPQSPRLRVAWDPVEGASYRVFRSTSPSFVPATNNRVYSGPGEACPQGESPNTPTDDSPPGDERDGICFTDTKVSLLQTYYYRVVAVVGTTTGGASGLAYGTPTRYDRQVRLKVDRLYGPQYWEQALVSSSPTPLETSESGTQWRFAWDTLELLTGEHDLFARSFTQGIGSTKVGRTLANDGDPNPDPDCGRGDDGDGDCEDDNDEEEDDDD